MVELEVRDIMSRVSGNMVFAVILKEKDGNRVLPVMVGLLEAQAISAAMKGISLPRPSIYDLYLTSSRSFDAYLQGVRIYKIQGGIFYSYLVFEKDGGTMMIDSRTSDAIALALRAGVPLFIEEELIDRYSAQEERTGSFSMPIATVDAETLRAALANAIETENYELAAQLRDELSKRK